MSEEFQVAKHNEVTQNKYCGSIYTNETPLPDDFVKGVKELEEELGMPVWMLVQGESDSSSYNYIGHEVYKGFFDKRNSLPNGRPVALLLRSNGGDASCAYKLSNLFTKHCGEFTVLIPNYAKSAATLLALGSNHIVLGTYAELGPLDMQVNDEDGAFESALNHVQTLERLGAYSKTTLDEIVMMLLLRTGKKISAVLPHAIEFTASIVRPLMEKIEVVKYSEMSRLLKIGEDYAERLLKPKYGRDGAKIAKALVSKYPEHGFVIDATEAKSIGLQVESPEGKISEAFVKLLPFVDGLTVLGCLQEVN